MVRSTAPANECFPAEVHGPWDEAGLLDGSGLGLRERRVRAFAELSRMFFVPSTEGW